MSERFTDEELAVVRRAYARQMVLNAGAPDAALERAFATVPRERFLGHEKWLVKRFSGAFHEVPENDPVYVYQDALVALAEGGVNNGSPALHAAMLHALDVRPGQRVAHLGAGTGYFTAILAELAGASGEVLAVEFDAGRAAAARENLAPWKNVSVVAGDAAEFPTGRADRVYVNFSVTEPAAPWLRLLTEGGRLVFPLGAPHPAAKGPRAGFAAQGAALAVERRGEAYAARWLCQAFFILAEGKLRRGEAGLYKAFERGGVEFVKSLRWEDPGDPARCWYWTPEWSLSFDAQ